MLANSCISAVILVSRVNSANPDISWNLCVAVCIFFQISDCGSKYNSFSSATRRLYNYCSPCSWEGLQSRWLHWKCACQHEHRRHSADHQVDRCQRPGTQHGRGSPAASDHHLDWFPSHSICQYGASLQRAPMPNDFTHSFLLIALLISFKKNIKIRKWRRIRKIRKKN